VLINLRVTSEFVENQNLPLRLDRDELVLTENWKTQLETRIKFRRLDFASNRSKKLETETGSYFL